MKIVEMNKVNGKDWEKAINSYEVIGIVRNKYNNTITADLFTKCKRPSTAINRFFKALEGYYAFNKYKERIKESAKQEVFEEDAIKQEGFAFSISGGNTYYYISVTIPADDFIVEEEEQEEQEQEEENTSMEDIKIKTSWSKVLKNENEWSDTDKEYIILDIDMKGVTSWSLGCDIMDSLENKINKDGFYSCIREGCPDFDEEKNTFSDCLFFERDYGSILVQRKEIIKYVNSIKKEVINEVLKEQEEQEQEEQEKQAFETLDKNKKQILKHWKALAEADLTSKELNEQAKEFYNLFKSVLI